MNYTIPIRPMRTIGVLLIAMLLFGCQEDLQTPKPRSYPKVVYPKKSYQQYKGAECPFTFQQAVYTKIVQDKTYFDEAPPTDCWFDLYYPQFDGSVHFTYYPIAGNYEEFERLREETFRLANWHNKRANYIDEILIQTPKGIGGIAFDIDGPAASPFQFFLTDSTEHYLRGALYFNTEARADSLQPITNFVREDILHLIESFEWVD